jgi:small subunit ribosomal protein S2
MFICGGHNRKIGAIMAIPSFSMRQLLEAGVHFGHHTRRWNPRMEPFIFGQRNNIHILDLQQTVPMLGQALEAMRNTVLKGGRVLFVGTKRVAADKIAETAQECGQYYVNHRWLGGMLTNWATVSQSIRRLRDLEARLESDEVNALGKKEILQLNRERDKLELTLGGIKEMGGVPDMLFILDTNKEDIAVLEANKLGIPVVAVVDSNASPDGVDYPIPGNDDAMRAISLYCDLAKGAILDGLQAELMASGGDIGASEAAPAEAAVAEASEEAPAEAVAAEEAPAEGAVAEKAAAEEAPVEEAAVEEAPSA